MTVKYRVRETGEEKTKKQIEDERYPATFSSTWTPQTCEELGIDPILATPKPSPSSSLKSVVKDNSTQDALGNWVQAWQEVDKFSDIPDGPTKTEQEAAFLAQEQADATAALKKSCEEAIVALIQAEVDIYNEANGLVFENIYTCESYSRTDGYSHQAWCLAVWNWNVAVWEAARTTLTQALAGEITITSPEELIALLPEFIWET